MSLNPFALSMVLAGVVCSTLVVYLWPRRAAGSRMFAMMMAAVSIWALAYGMELASIDYPAMRLWLRVEYLGIATAPAFWLLFALEYSGAQEWLARGRAAAAFVVPALVIALNVTNELHGLYYTSIAVDRSGPLPLLALGRGPFYWLNLAFGYGCLLAGGLMIVRLWLHAPTLYRRQGAVLLLGACVPLLANVAYLFGLRPFQHLDLSPLAFTATGLIITFGIFRYKLFDLAPIAREALFERLREPVIVVDGHGRIADLNAETRRVLGPRLCPHPGVSAHEALAPWPTLASFCADAGEGAAEVHLGEIEQAIYEARRSPLLDGRGRSKGSIVVLYDLTARKRAEAQRLDLERQVQQAQKLESIGILAGGVAHDFNNLLTAVLGNLELLRFELPPGAPELGLVQEAERAARHGADLTRQLLAYAGKGAFLVRPVDLSTVVREIAQILRVSVGGAVSFDLRLSSGLPLFSADAAQIQQIVLNLVTNASEAIGDRSGAITLETGTCVCSAEELARSRVEQLPQPGWFVFLRVTDDGVGMGEETISRLFEPFYSTKSYGRGLGMAAVLGIVGSYGGAIIVTSSQGAGTEVVVLFPVAE